MWYLEYLGEIYICPEYVHQVLVDDQERDPLSLPPLPEVEDTSPSMLSAYEAYHEQPEARGVNVWMMRSYYLEERLKLLLVHSVLHLLGYDHELREEYEQMVLKEEEVVSTLKHLKVL